MQPTLPYPPQPKPRSGARIPEPVSRGGRSGGRHRALNSGRLLLLLLLGGGFIGWRGSIPESMAAESASLEYKVKAAFLYNFAKFIEWPTNRFPEPDSPIIIGVVGEDPFGSILDDTVKGKTINGRPFLIRRLARGKDLKQCHLLFMSRSLNQDIEIILAGLKSQSVLTVSEAEQFARRGGMIALLIVDNTVKFEINLDTTEAAGLKVSAKLASVARVIKREAPASP
jgi:hypothetical protein